MVDVRETLPEEYRAEYDKVMAMEASPMRDELVLKIVRMAKGECDYFDWNGVAVRVACAGGACQTFRDGAWQDGGPSYSVRQEECDPLTREELARRWPAAVSSDSRGDAKSSATQAASAGRTSGALPPVVQTIDSRELAAVHLERLKVEIAAWGGSSERASNLGGEIAIVLIALLLLVSSTVGASKGYYGRAAGMGAFSLALLWLGVHKLRKRFGSPVGTFALATDAYYVRSEGGTLKVYSLAHVASHSITNHLRNGIYSTTIMTVRFDDGTTTDISENLEREARTQPAMHSRLFKQVLAGAANARAARDASTWSTLTGADMFPLLARS